MTKEQLNSLEELLDKRYKLAIKHEEELGNDESILFAKNNTYYIYYCGILAACEALELYVDKCVNPRTQEVTHKLY